MKFLEGQEAVSHVVGQPANVLLYGGPGLEKTTDAVMAFIKDGRCTACLLPFEDGALKSVAARGIPLPRIPDQTLKTWGDVTEAFAWLGQNRDRFNALILDGFSTLAANIYKEAEAQHKGNKNKFAIPLQVRSCLVQIREWVRLLGVHSIFICHPLPPAVLDGIFYQGGFALSPKSLVPEFFGAVDTVLRVDHLVLPGRPPIRVYYTGSEQWPAELGTFGQPQDWRLWRCKNREGIAQAVVPANLGAVLRARQPPYPGL